MSSPTRDSVQKFSSANNLLAVKELVLSLLGYSVFIYGIYYSYSESIWLGYILCTLVGGLFMIKVFTIQHDCGHGSFFTAPILNTWTGRLLALFTTMPYNAWKYEHDIHHSHVVDIDSISHGDITLLTVEQYRELSPRDKFFYRLIRHPIFYLVVAPFVYFFVKSKIPGVWNRPNILSVAYTNIFILIIYGGLVWYFGFWTTVFVFVPAAYVGGIIGIGLFYLQHDYPEATWFKKDDWSHEEASLQGSSLMVLPQPLEWLTHSIGYHHIHHLNSKVPGYRLRECYEQVPEMREVEPLSWRDVLEAYRLKLWSHERNSLINFAEADKVQS